MTTDLWNNDRSVLGYNWIKWKYVTAIMYKLGSDIVRWQTKSFLPSSPTEHQFWQLPTDQNTFVGAWESSTFLEQKKISQNRFIEEGKKNTVSLYLHHPSPKKAQFSGQRDSLGCSFSQRRKRECSEWAPGFPSCVGCCQRGPLPSHPTPEYWGDLHDWGVKRSWEHSSQGSECIKGTWIILTTLWTLWGGWLMSQWGHFTCRFPQQAQWHPKYSTYLTHTHIRPATCMPLQAASVSLSDSWWVCAESWPDSMELEKAQKLENFRALASEKKTGSLSTSPGFSDQEKVYSPKNFPPRGKKRCGAGTSIEKEQESFKIPRQADWWRHFSPQASQ